MLETIAAYDVQSNHDIHVMKNMQTSYLLAFNMVTLVSIRLGQVVDLLCSQKETDCHQTLM